MKEREPSGSGAAANCGDPLEGTYLGYRGSTGGHLRSRRREPTWKEWEPPPEPLEGHSRGVEGSWKLQGFVRLDRDQSPGSRLRIEDASALLWAWCVSGESREPGRETLRAHSFPAALANGVVHTRCGLRMTTPPLGCVCGMPVCASVPVCVCAVLSVCEPATNTETLTNNQLQLFLPSNRVCNHNPITIFHLA